MADIKKHHLLLAWLNAVRASGMACCSSPKQGKIATNTPANAAHTRKIYFHFLYWIFDFICAGATLLLLAMGF